MSHTDKDKPYSIRARQNGRKHECDITCTTLRRHSFVQTAQAIFYAHEAAQIALFMEVATEHGFEVTRHEKIGYLHLEKPDSEELRRRERTTPRELAQLVDLRRTVANTPGEPGELRYRLSEDWSRWVIAPKHGKHNSRPKQNVFVELAAVKHVTRDPECWSVRNGGYELEHWQDRGHGGRHCYCWFCTNGRRLELSTNQRLRELDDELWDPYPLDDETLPGRHHVLIAGRCVHCDTDDHSAPNAGEILAPWELPCPATGAERWTTYTVDVDGTHSYA